MFGCLSFETCCKFQNRKLKIFWKLVFFWKFSIFLNFSILGFFFSNFSIIHEFFINNHEQMEYAASMWWLGYKLATGFNHFQRTNTDWLNWKIDYQKWPLHTLSMKFNLHKKYIIYKMLSIKYLEDLKLFWIPKENKIKPDTTF